MVDPIMNIGTALIRPSKTNPRHTFDPAAMKELVESIKVKGLVYPITVRPDGDGKYELIDGERRLRAVKEAGIPSIPAYVRKMTDEEAVEAQLISFVQTEGITPLEEAEAYNRYVKSKTGPVDIKEIAAKFGKDRRYIAQRVQLWKLIPEFKEALKKEKVSLAGALEIAKLHPNGQQQLYASTRRRSWVLEDDDDLLSEIKDEFLLRLGSAPFKLDDGELVKKAGACNGCPKRSDVNQDLFGDLKKEVLCLDASCYRAKVDAFFERESTRYADEGKKLLRITPDSYPQASLKALGREKYRIVQKSMHDGVHFGILVESGYSQKIGQIVPIHLEGQKEDRNPGEKRPAPTMAARMANWKRRIEIFEQKINQAARLRMVEAILKEIAATRSVQDADLSAVACLIYRGGDRRINFIRVFELMGIKKHGMDDFYQGMKTKTERLIESFSRVQTMKFLIACVCDEDQIDDVSLHDDGQAHIDEFAKRYNVNVAKIRKDVAAEMESKRPKKPVAEKPAKKQKRSRTTKKSKKSKK